MELAPPSISLCMIARDEEARIGRCLASIRDLADQMIVGDTGSQDQTKAVAERLGATVVDFPWADSFATARNQVLEHARGNWVIWLDADEWLDDDNRRRLATLRTSLTADRAYLMKQWSRTARGPGRDFVVDQPRLFPRLPGLHWRFRVHEQVWPSLAPHGLKLTPTDIVIWHDGFAAPEALSRKVERNHALLLKDMVEFGDNPFVLYNLGISLLDLNRPGEAIDALTRCLRHASANDSYLPKAYVYLALALQRADRLQDALGACQEGRNRFPQFAELWYEEGMLHRRRRDLPLAKTCLDKALRVLSMVSLAGTEASAGPRTRFFLGKTCQELGQAAEAEQHWRSALALDSSHLRSWSALADLFLEKNRIPELRALLDAVPPDGDSLAPMYRARLDLLEGRPELARQRIEAAIAVFPTRPWLKLFLAELLCQRAPCEALRLIEEVIQHHPTNAKALQMKERLRRRTPPG